MKFRDLYYNTVDGKYYVLKYSEGIQEVKPKSFADILHNKVDYKLCWQPVKRGVIFLKNDGPRIWATDDNFKAVDCIGQIPNK